MPPLCRRLIGRVPTALPQAAVGAVGSEPVSPTTDVHVQVLDQYGVQMPAIDLLVADRNECIANTSASCTRSGRIAKQSAPMVGDDVHSSGTVAGIDANVELGAGFPSADAQRTVTLMPRPHAAGLAARSGLSSSTASKGRPVVWGGRCGDGCSDAGRPVGGVGGSGASAWLVGALCGGPCGVWLAWGRSGVLRGVSAVAPVLRAQLGLPRRCS